MTTLDERLAACLRATRPRENFSAELLASLLHDRYRLQPLGPAAEHSRSRWLVAGAVAGFLSATGAAYVAVRRHHRGAA